MTAIFDLAKIEDLIAKQNIKAVLVIDSGILLDEPDLNNWQTGLENPLFVMPCTLDLELEHLKSQPDFKSNACLASDHFVQICAEGEINAGIFREKVGWFISPPSPERRKIDRELENLGLLTRSMGRLNTQLVLLGREIQQKNPALTVVLVTRDRQVYNALRLIDIKSHLFSGFPVNIDVKSPQVAAAPDWNQVLQVIQKEAEKKRTELSLTLLRKSVPPSWLVLPQNKPTLIAEGKGRLRSQENLYFNWTLLFEPWDFPPSGLKALPAQSGTETEEFIPVDEDWLPGKVHLEIDGAVDGIPAHLYQTITRMILKCASPMAYIEDLPTLQEPLSILKQLLIIEYAFQERKLHGDIKPDDFKEMETRMRDPDNLLNWAFFWLRERQSEAKEVDISFIEFLHALRSCWNIGETYKFDLMEEPAQAAHTEEKKQS